MNEFVTVDIAKILNEKGFREKCLAYYDVLDNVGILYNTQYTDDFSPCQYTDLLFSHNSGEGKQTDDSEYCVDAPTISQVLNWLRKEKKIHIGFGYSPRKKWRYVAMYMDDRFYNKPTLSVDGFLDIKQAALAGIENTLDNLI